MGRYLWLSFTVSLVVVPVIWLCRRLGLPWWATGLVAVVALIGAERLLTAQSVARGRTRFELGLRVKHLLVISENGGYLDIRHSASPFRMRIFRQSGDDLRADVLVSIPRESWSEPRLPQIRDLFDRQDVPHTTEDRDLVHVSSLIEARIHNQPIWVSESGAMAARVAHLVLDLFGIGPQELLDLRYQYEPSFRWRRHRDKFAMLD